MPKFRDAIILLRREFKQHRDAVVKMTACANAMRIELVLIVRPLKMWVQD